MPTKLLTIDNDEQQKQLAVAVVVREQEIAAYEVNIEVYRHAVANPQTKPEAKARFEALLLTEQQQLDISLALYAGLLARLPAERVQTLVRAAKTELDAARTAARP